MTASQNFVRAIMGAGFSGSGGEMNLAAIVDKEVKSSTPVLMCSVSGYDASDRVVDLTAQEGKPISSVAIGSAEGFLQVSLSCLNIENFGFTNFTLDLYIWCLSLTVQFGRTVSPLSTISYRLVRNYYSISLAELSCSKSFGEMLTDPARTWSRG